MNKKKLMISLVVGLLSLATHAADNLPDLHVQGKNLVDVNGNTVVLHGVMDTPNRYFNNWLWQTVCRHYRQVAGCLLHRLPSAHGSLLDQRPRQEIYG